MTDEELDRDWKPSGRRPQSTLARSFSQELMDIFRIDNSVADLDEQVDRRKQQINTRTSELEALEARIREMEERLQQPGSSSQTRGGVSTHDNMTKRLAEAHAEHRTQTAAIDTAGRTNRQTSHQRSPVAGLFSQHQQHDKPQQASTPDRGDSGRKYGSSSRPGTARQSQQAVPGALPPTPTSSDGEGE